MKLARVIATALLLSTATAACAVSPKPASQEVQFANGATEATYHGTAHGNHADRYTFYARKGQVLNVEVSGSNADLGATVSYLGKENAPRLGATHQVLPYNGRYEIRVANTRNGAQDSAAYPYAVKISIKNAGANVQVAQPAAAQAQPVFENHPVKTTKVQFARGATGAKYTGSIKGYGYDSYRVTAKGGQTLAVSVKGNPYLAATVSRVSANGELSPIPSASMLPDSQVVLPESGEYDIRVLQMRAGARKGNTPRQYRLNINIH